MVNRHVKTAEKAHELGRTHNNFMANTNGLDEIDLWAMRVGQAEYKKSKMTPARKHINSI